MKERKIIKTCLIIISISLMMCLASNVYAADLVDITSNTAGKTDTVDLTNGGTQNSGNTQEITNIEQPTFRDVNETVYATANVNVKNSYSATATTVGTLTKDQSVTRTGIGSNGWSRIKMSNGQVGYVEASYLTTTAPQVTPISNNTSVYNNVSNTLPTTGLESNTGAIVLMVICVIAAIYAYKKIRDYNV